MYHNICSVLDGTNQIRSTKSVINNQRYVMAMCYFCHSLYIYNIRIRIPQSLDKHRLCILLNSFLKIRKITRVHKCSSHTISRQRMRQQVISTSVNSLCSYNMITCTSNVLKRISNGSSPGSYRKSCHSPFQCSHTLFKNSLSGISQSPSLKHTVHYHHDF